MKFGGLDLSLTSTGWAVLDDDGALVSAGRVRPGEAWPIGQRYDFLAESIWKAMQQVDVVARERPFANGRGGGDTDAALFGVHAVVQRELWLRQERDEIPQVAPSTLLKLATGSGKARKGSKAEVIDAAIERWGSDVDQTDIADACWVAEWLRLEWQSGRLTG